MDDLISRKAAIQEINDLLKSPYAHSQLGETTASQAFHIRKEMAEIIIDLCVKRANCAYDVDKVVEQLEEKAICSGNQESGFILLNKAIAIVKGAVKDE
jgi:hypothetical protein